MQSFCQTHSMSLTKTHPALWWSCVAKR